MARQPTGPQAIFQLSKRVRSHRFGRRFPVVDAAEQPGETGADDERGERDHHRDLGRHADLKAKEAQQIENTVAQTPHWATKSQVHRSSQFTL